MSEKDKKQPPQAADESAAPEINVPCSICAGSTLNVIPTSPT